MNQEPSDPFVTKVLLRQPLSSFRLVIALFTVASALTKLLYDTFLPDLADFNQIRWGIIGLGVILFTYTFIPYYRRIVVPYFSLLLYLATLLYVVTFVIINHFDPSTVIILILVYGASSVVINNLLYYGVQCTITILAFAIAHWGFGQGNENLIGLLNVLMAMGVFGVVMKVRLKLVSDLMDSYANLERLNVFSIVANRHGEIVFISPSAKALLGYSPKELLKDAWWESNLREGWITREYILNYPGMVPKEIANMESNLVTRDGKKVWFSWVNSILPNGNYMGVAWDITKYKT